MKVDIREDRGRVYLTKGNMKVVLSKEDFEKRVCEVAKWYETKKRKAAEFDHYHGCAAAMFDPGAPFPKSFTHKFSERWKPSGSKSGACYDSSDLTALLLKKIGGLK